MRNDGGRTLKIEVDPDADGAELWTGTRTDFCLVCHDGEPPEGVSFPAESAGLGFDKLGFMGSALAQSEQGCSTCHTPHGSPYPALLKNLHRHSLRVASSAGGGLPPYRGLSWKISPNSRKAALTNNPNGTYDN